MSHRVYPFETSCKHNEMIKSKIMDMLKEYICEMEKYSYYGSNPGIPEDQITEIAARIVEEFI